MHYQKSILEPNVKIPAPTDAKNGAQYSRASNTSGQPSHFYAASLRSQSAVRWFSSSAIPRHFFPARHFHFSPSILLVQAHKALGLMPAMLALRYSGRHGLQVGGDRCGRGGA